MIKYNGYVIGKGGFWLKATEKPVDPYNPYNLDPGVVRLTFHASSDYDPNTDVGGPDIGYWTRVEGSTWDFHPEYLGLEDKFHGLSVSFNLESWNLRDYSGHVFATFRNSKLVNINNPIDFSVSSINGIPEMFAQSHIVYACPGIRLQPNQSAQHMFRHCQELIEIPVFDWDYVPGTIEQMFANDYYVMTGITRLYDNWSTVGNHSACFRDCGSNTVTGAAELAQIPSDWK